LLFRQDALAHLTDHPAACRGFSGKSFEPRSGPSVSCPGGSPACFVLKAGSVYPANVEITLKNSEVSVRHESFPVPALRAENLADFLRRSVSMKTRRLSSRERINENLADFLHGCVSMKTRRLSLRERINENPQTFFAGAHQ
jgi:hypothetical protein